jgi:hypothetical protein
LKENSKKPEKKPLEFVKVMIKELLLSQRYFYEAIYKPQRDELANKWSELISLK